MKSRAQTLRQLHRHPNQAGCSQRTRRRCRGSPRRRAQTETCSHHCSSCRRGSACTWQELAALRCCCTNPLGMEPALRSLPGSSFQPGTYQHTVRLTECFDSRRCGSSIQHCTGLSAQRAPRLSSSWPRSRHHNLTRSSPQASRGKSRSGMGTAHLGESPPGSKSLPGMPPAQPQPSPPSRRTFQLGTRCSYFCPAKAGTSLGHTSPGDRSLTGSGSPPGTDQRSCGCQHRCCSKSLLCTLR